MRSSQSRLLSRRVSGGQAAPESCTTRGPPHRARGGSTKAAARSRAGGQTDPALIDWQRFGRFRLPQENRSYKFAHLQCIGESASLRKERPRGAKPRHQIRNQCSRPHTKMRNVMMNISWTYKGNTAKLTRLVKALNEHSRAWREVMNKEGDAREAVGMLCQSDLRLRL